MNHDDARDEAALRIMPSSNSASARLRNDAFNKLYLEEFMHPSRAKSGLVPVHKHFVKHVGV
jgi:hypothetical protein